MEESVMRVEKKYMNLLKEKHANVRIVLSLHLEVLHEMHFFKLKKKSLTRMDKLGTLKGKREFKFFPLTVDPCCQFKKSLLAEMPSLQVYVFFLTGYIQQCGQTKD